MASFPQILYPLFRRIRDAIVRHVGFFMYASRDEIMLREGLDELTSLRDDVARRVERAERVMSVGRTAEVAHWMQKVKVIEDEINKLLPTGRESSCNCWSKYRISRMGEDMLKEVRELSARPTFNDVAVDPHPPSGVAMLKVPVVSAQLELNLQRACYYIDDDDEAGVIGIWGMAGVGKTTLLTEINANFVQNGHFDRVIYISVSKYCPLEEFKMKIAMRLGMTVVEGMSPSTVAGLLNDSLRNKSFLLLLDDVWEPLNLVSAGIPHPLGSVHGRKRKVVLTTRSKNVCGNMEASLHIIKVECLNREESWLLFQQRVGEQFIQSHPRITSLAHQVVDECGGLPLALITVAGAMSTKMSVDDWEYALHLLRASRLQDVSGTTNETFYILKLSYDYLRDDRTRMCFLSCSLWPKDFNILKDELVECWMGLNLLDDCDDIDEAYLLGHSVINTLQAACLLEPGDEDYTALSNTRVKMHDVIRDLALWIASDCGYNSRKWIARSGLEMAKTQVTQEKWKEAKRVSLMHNKIETLFISPDACPDLEVLMLQYNNIQKIHTPVHGLQTFRALAFLDLSHNENLRVFPVDVFTLVELQYLNLSFTKIAALPDGIRSLRRLKHLHLRKTLITELPKGMLLELHNLQVLDLFSCPACVGESFFDGFAALEGRLKSLGISTCDQHDFADLGKLSGAPVTALCIQNLQNMTPIQFQTATIRNCGLLWKLTEMAIEDSSTTRLSFDISGGQVQDLMTQNLLTLSFVRLPRLRKVTWEGTPPMKLLPNLRMIVIHSCTTLVDITWVTHLPCLEHLEIRCCMEMEQLIESEDIGPLVPTFPHLRMLILYSLQRLCRISSNNVTFPSLEYFKVVDCGRLNRIPFGRGNSKLKKISGQQPWWLSLQWEDEHAQSFFNSLIDFTDVPYTQSAEDHFV